eukprot:GFUD01055476.1.p1 GENE.GFUD01055476.1~~GFUD01055476.1.p1  ORF type:complete len:133 (-),score=10.14 GFUD01055476.1:213-611(-)
MNQHLQLVVLAVFLTGPVNSLRCYEGYDLTSVECPPGVNHCLKLVKNENLSNENVTQSCAYFSMTPTELNTALGNSLEGTCFVGSLSFTKPPLYVMRGFLQCPCEADLCNGGMETNGGFLFLIVSIFALCLF